MDSSFSENEILEEPHLSISITRKELRSWLVNCNSLLLKDVITSKVSFTVFLTPLSTEASLDLRTKQIRWAALDTFLRNFTSNMIKNCTKESLPESVVSWFVQVLEPSYKFVEEDLLQLESELIQFKPNTQVRKNPKNEQEVFAIVACTLISKVFAQKVFFKPYKITELCGVNNFSVSPQFRDNSVIVGYVLLAALTDIIFELRTP